MPAFINPLLDSLLGFLLSWTPLAALVFISLIISLLSLIITKFTTNQSEMKRLKEELDANQKKMKTLRDDPQKMMKTQKEALSVQAQYFKKSMIPTFITLIPLGLILGWMSDHFSYEPLNPNEEFTLAALGEGTGNVTIFIPQGMEVIGAQTKQLSDGKVSFGLKGEEGLYKIVLESGESEVEKEVLISQERMYSPIYQEYEDSKIKSITLSNKELDVIWKIGWLGTYIICAIVFITVLRKLLKVY